MISTCLVLFLPCLITSVLTSNYNVTHLNNLSGLYFNNLGIAKLSNSEFTFLKHLNLSFADQKFSLLKHYYSQSFNLCSHKGTTSTFNHVIFFCENSLKVLDAKIKQIENKIETISHVSGRNLRFKRGIFDGASYALHWLFGIPDADDANYYDASIKALLNDNKNVQNLMKKQISIISDSILNFNASIMALRLNENKLNSNINLFNNFSEQTASNLNDLKLQSLITEQISLLTQIAFDLTEFYDSLISSITLARHNILHPQIITPRILMNELSKIVLKDNLQWPVTISYSTIDLYFVLIKLDVYYVNNNVIFALKIPLCEEFQYNVYETLPLPIPHNVSNLYSFIEPSFKYILLSTNKVYYAGLESLEKCLTLSPGEFICHQTRTLRSQEKPICETTLLTTPLRKLPTSCRTHTIAAEMEVWHPIHDNQWIYSLSNPIQITLTCANSHISDIQISSTGIFQMHPGCKAYTPTNVLEASQTLLFNFSSPMPDYNIVLDDCCINKNANLTLSPIKIDPIRIANVRLDELKYTTHKLKQLDKELQNKINEPLVFNKSSWFSSIITTLLSIVGALVLYKIFKLCGFNTILRKLLCLSSSHRNKDNCCMKIFNTNINTPVTPMQLQRIIQEEEALSREEEEAFSLRNIISSQPNPRRSKASIDME